MPLLIPEDLTEPGTHALVIGISAYQFLEGGDDVNPDNAHLGLKQLSSGARSASEFAGWLLDGHNMPELPLRSLRVLLAPAPGEVIHPAVQSLMKGDHAPTRANVEQAILDFMNATESHSENMAIIYVAGHGVQFTNEGAVLLLSDFGSPSHKRSKYAGAVDMTAIHKAMNYEGNANTQFWFLDLCRGLAPDTEDYDKLGGIFELDINRGEPTNTSPMFLSSSSGQTAYGRPNKVTLFNEALMVGLKEGYAAKTDKPNDPTWRVSTTSLIEYLPSAVEILATAHGRLQKVDVTGRVINSCLHECLSPPNVDLTVTICQTKNPSNYSAELSFRGNKIGHTLTSWPTKTKVRAGLYLVKVTTASPPDIRMDPYSIEPPASEMELPLQ
ncbi:caspase family protein [Pseudomonas sp. NBRC 111124]|uniref:caspase family protein n=1 Tax=Pseudomonas sp. NBRC 111124 TaxID=1661039 RepID=UPI0007622090|nr:caspase family protein [Pseudomonas sp. NBRC 111124]